jgi:hypothetical protein
MTFDGLQQNPAIPIFSGLTTVSLAGLPLRRRVVAIPDPIRYPLLGLAE